MLENGKTIGSNPQSTGDGSCLGGTPEKGEEDEEEGKRLRKRARSPDVEDDQNPDFPGTKVQAKCADVLFRIVVPSGKIGCVIGKKGSRIQKIREETKATIKIADALAPFEERVIIISSTNEEDKISSAELALHHIAELILKENDSGAEASSMGAGHAATNMIRLLIAGSQAGGLIGVSGQKIEEIRNSSGANVQLMAPNQLPSCASTYESDRLVQVSGETHCVLKALEKIANKLKEKPPKRVISIRPTYNINQAFSGSSYYGAPVGTVTSEMLVSESLVGGLIGKHGLNISNIRMQSGATIKVVGGKGETRQRHIHIEGSPEQVALAKMLVENCIRSQLSTGAHES